MSAQLVGVPVDPEVLARVLERQANYRVLRQLEPMNRTSAKSRDAGVLTGCCLAVKTTGLDLDACRIIELAVQRFHFDNLGRILETGCMRSWLEDPGDRLTPTISRRTGLTDLELGGRTIAEGEATSIIATCDVIVAQNAAFGRPFVERRLSGIVGGRWICSMQDLDWAQYGYDGRSLGYLLGDCGWFQDGRRAPADVNALLHVLDHRLDTSGTVLRELVRAAARSTWLVEATATDVAKKDVLRARGYRWDWRRRAWAREVGATDLDDEIEWNIRAVYDGRGHPKYSEITWEQRYARP